ncbi:primosomal protein N' [Campylobacter insulaenigrae]|uniref:primosomal protein N' n=1 Tax=Campylobacter insulaenigrae TaxID=260714 RepID=UPI0021537FFB|nr:primosomal protein N' [Campylobacter insulaenigrae]MCR6583240.1 primosomal protein N' [Campylobacter insulaenigrae]
MKYYELAIKGYYLDTLIFESQEYIEPLSEVVVDVARKKNLKAIVLKECPKPEFKTQIIKEKTYNKITNFQYELAKFIAYYYASKISFVLGMFESIGTCILEKSLYVENTPKLNIEQKKALNFIKEHKISLLFGDTGCGKTEIYISLIKEYLEQGKQVLLLMPEIALTPQMQKRLKIYFNEYFFLWHSKISKKKKQDYLQNLQNSSALLVAGARSALFLPFENLGLIIVDEEDDNSYKANNNPRLNARDLALFLANKKDIKILLGSATPSVTSFYKHPVYRLKGTFFESQKEILYDESEDIISSKLLLELRNTLKEKKQAIIFLPIRANFRQILCKNCGITIKCPFCSVALSMHKKKNILKCHYCNFIKEIDKKCPSCDTIMLEAKKMGTAELCERLEKEFSEYNIVIKKFDSDEISSIKKLDNILKDFNDQKIDILVGTSMLAKGHDYHSVSLSVVLGLDEYLFRPNFKALEETLSLAIQVAGRAGRKGFGRVLLQTKNRIFFEKYLQNYDAFLEDELNTRKNLYPPYIRLLRLIIEDEDRDKANVICEYLTNYCRNFKQVEVIGSGNCAIEILNKKWRFNVLLRSKFYHELVKIEHFALNFKNVICDIDPIEFN